MKKRHTDACAAAHALELVGDRWALLVVRQLILGPKRFTDLRAGLPNISPNVLTQRLEELEKSGIIVRHKLPPPASAWVYDLTDWGRDLEPVIVALGRWAVRSPFLPQGGTINSDSLILSFRAMFNREAAEGMAAEIELQIGDERYRATIERGEMSIVRGASPKPEAILKGSPDAIAAVIYGGVKLSSIEVEGDKNVARRFISLFPLPERVTALPPSAAARS